MDVDDPAVRAVIQAVGVDGTRGNADVLSHAAAWRKLFIDLFSLHDRQWLHHD